MHSEPIHPAVRVGHVHLYVSDLDRALAFYRDALGLTVTGDLRAAGIAMVFLAAGDYHHHIGLTAAAGARPPAGGPGLFHLALLYPDRRELARALRRLLDHGVRVDHASDHGGSVALYLDDPDGNGIELTYDRPRSTWSDADGRPVLRADRFDPLELLESGSPISTTGV